MKKSNYNFFYKIEEGILAYNAKTNAMAVIENEKLGELKKILQGNEGKDEKFVKDLKYGGFIVEDQIDELQILRHDMYVDRFSSNALNLTIAPTSDCNFRCPYCYEKDVLHVQRMTDETANKLVEFVQEKASGIGSLEISWYGGEPMMEYNRIQELSQRFMKICREHEIAYDAGIITNGYLLTQEKLEKLIEYKVSSVQITLDGTKETHDSRRFLKNHGGSFEKIIENLLSFEKLAEENKDFPVISIRMNIDRSNQDEAFQLLELITSTPLKNYVIPYVAGVYDPNDTDHVQTLTDREYNNLKDAFIRNCEEKGFSVDYKAFYPDKITSNCCCDKIDSLVIDAHGDLYKCWEEIGTKEACIGNIEEKDYYNMPKRYYNYLLYDPTLDEECSKCGILPICMGGGCPIRRERDRRRDCKLEQQVFESKIFNSAEKLGKSIQKELSI